MGKLRNTLILIAAVVGVAVGIVAVQARNMGNSPTVSLPKSYPSPSPLASGVLIVESPDGAKALTMKQEKSKEGTVHTFSVSNQVIFKEITTFGSDISIPQNTFSPDNKYILLKETSGGSTNYLVLATSGENLPKVDTQSLDISSLFATKYPDYKVTDVTGWGGPTLVIINTDKAGGGSGPTFWYDVASGSFIQLAIRFN